MYLGFMKGRNAMLAKASLKVETKKESTLIKKFPIIPKEKAQTIDTVAK